jgi:hypothetical protein
MRRIFASLLILSCFAVSASAATLEGVTLQDTFPVEGQTLKMNGIGLRTLTIFNVKVYVAALYLATPSHDAKRILASTTPKVIRLQFLHAGSKADIEKQYRAGQRTNCGDGSCAGSDAAAFDRLVAAAPAVNVGDTSTYIFTSKGVRVLANDRPLIELNNPDIAYHLLEGFIGAHPPSASLRAALLGIPAS